MTNIEVQSDLSYIKSVMEQSRPDIVINGWHFIMWGILTFFGILNTYLAILSGPDNSQIFYAWIVIVLFGWLCSFGISWYERKKGNVQVKPVYVNHIHRITTSCGIVMIIFGFVAPFSGTFSSYAICPAISAILGIMYFMIGGIVKNKMISYLGFAWWLGSIGLFLMTTQKDLRVHSLLIYGLLLILLQVVPGFILNKKFRTQIKTEERAGF